MKTIVYCVNEYSRRALLVEDERGSYLEMCDGTRVDEFRVGYNCSFPSRCETSVELHVDDYRRPADYDRAVVVAYALRHEDIMKIPLAANLLHKEGFKQVELLMPYFPYARMDRNMGSGIPVSVKVMADLINSCGFSRVTVYDPHSTAVELLVDNLQVMVPAPSRKFLNDSGRTCFVAPDAGATKRAISLAQRAARSFQRDDVDGYVASKTRGKYGVYVSAPNLFACGDTRVVVIDDICDGGATFAELERELKRANPDATMELQLLVTHGLFTGDAEENLVGYSKIFVSNSYPIPQWAQRKTEVIQMERAQ